MAFPNTPVLDDFNTGASQNLTARTGWGANVWPTAAATSFATDGVPTAAVLAVVGGNNWGTLSWADMEVYCTASVFTPATDELVIGARIQSFGASGTYYALDLASSSSTSFELTRTVAGTRTVIATTTQTHTNGDAYGLSVIGTTIAGYHKVGAGAWTQILSTTDSSITGTGGIGFRHFFAHGMTIDDFGGGEIAGASTPARDTHTAIPFTQGAGGGAMGGGGPH